MPAFVPVWRRLAVVGDGSKGALAGTVVYPPGANYGERVQTCYQLILPQNAQLLLVAGQRRTPLPPGTVGLLRPGRVTIEFPPDGESCFSWLSVWQPPLTPEHVASLIEAPDSLPVSDAMARLMETALALPDSVPSSVAPLAALITAALVLYAEESRARGLVGEAPLGHPAVAAARALVRHHLGEPLSLADMAGAGHVAPDYLVRLFRRELGTTPSRYLWAERARAGVELLVHTGLPVAEVAAQLGFQTPEHFSRLVRAATGLNPRALRRHHWQPSNTPALGA